MSYTPPIELAQLQPQETTPTERPRLRARRRKPPTSTHDIRDAGPMLSLTEQMEQRVWNALEASDCQPKRENDSFRFNCPAHDGSDSGGGVFYPNRNTGCPHFVCNTRKCSYDKIRDALGLTDANLLIDLNYTIERYCKEKHFDIAWFTKEFRARNLPNGKGVEFSAYNEKERKICTFIRRMVKKPDGWKPVTTIKHRSTHHVYGLNKIDLIHTVDYIVFCEGPSDVHTLRLHKILAFGVPGSDTANDIFVAPEIKRTVESAVAAGKKIYLFHESDEAGDKFISSFADKEYRDQLRVVSLKDHGFKDPSELHIAKETEFKKIWADTINSAKSWSAPLGGMKVARRYEFTDTGLAERFADQHYGKIRYVLETKEWLIWNGRFWQPDKIRTIQSMMIKTIRSIYPQPHENLSTEEIERRVKFARQSENASRISAALGLAAGLPGIATSAVDLDKDIYKLTCGNGTLNLDGVAFGPANPADLITKHTPINYDPNAECPQFLKFLERIQPDPEIRAYLQMCIGYMLTGDISEQKVLIFCGPGSSGKSTFGNICLKLAGEHGLQAEPDLLLNKMNEHFAMPATLHGKRMVFSSEPPRNAKLATARIKAWSGGEKISANKKYGQPYEFAPTFKITMTTNFLPRVNDNDYAIWRRLFVIPFNETIKGAELDKRLPQKLEAELPGILAWAVEGSRQWRATGLVEPRGVLVATQSYRIAEDRIQEFLTARTVEKISAQTPLKILYESYQTWADAEHEPLMPKDEFRAMLEGRGYVRTRTGGVVRISGLAEKTGLP